MTSISGTMLVVDDDELDRLLITANLEEGGYTVRVADNGQQALDLLRAQSFDVVLLDLVMPGVDGYQVLEQIKSDNALRHIPVIVISALDDMESVIRCIEMGAADYLQKPFDPVLLHARINTSLANKRLHDIEQAYLKQIEDEHSRLQALIASSRDGLVMVGQDGQIRVINSPTLQLLKLPGSCEDWLGKKLISAIWAIRRQSRNTVKVIIAEMHQFGRDGGELTDGELEIVGRIIRWMNLPVVSGNTALGRLLVFRDVTEERSLEKMRDDLTHTLVHDLRNPLGNIRTSLGLLATEERSCLTSYQRDLLEVARNCTERMLDLVNAILDLGRLESGQVPLKRQNISLSDLMIETLLLQVPQAQEKSLTFEDDIPANVPLVWVDASLIRRVLQNLIGNAVKFTPPGGTIRVKVEVTGSYILVSVCDTGPGITKEVQDRLFQKFVTGRADGHGSGLGLAFCRLVIEAHGGHIWVNSEPGHGSTFFFTLPVARLK